MLISKKELEIMRKGLSLHNKTILALDKRVEELERQIKMIKEDISLDTSHRFIGSIGYQTMFLRHEIDLLLEHLGIEVEEYEKEDEIYNIPTHKAYRIKKVGKAKITKWKE